MSMVLDADLYDSNKGIKSGPWYWGTTSLRSNLVTCGGIFFLFEDPIYAKIELNGKSVYESIFFWIVDLVDCLYFYRTV